MRISDWSSDVCSSDLGGAVPDPVRRDGAGGSAVRADRAGLFRHAGDAGRGQYRRASGNRRRDQSLLGVRVLPLRYATRVPGVGLDGKSVVQGKMVSVRVDLGGGRNLKKKKKKK